jgi:hypothetical protein
MNEQERGLDLMVGELEHENRLVRARNGRLEAEVTVLTEMVRVLFDKIADIEAKQEQGEPVALPCCGYTDASAVKWNPFNGVVQCHNCGQTYTTTQQRTWVGLTDEQIEKLAYKNGWPHPESRLELARAIEAKLKEKNT